MHRHSPLFRQPLALAAATLLTLAAILAAGPASSATVRCATASKPAEFAICNSEELQTLDARVDSAYRRQYAAAGVVKTQELSREQSDWQREIAGCRNDMACIERKMRGRLGDLSGGSKQAAKPKAKPVAEFRRFADNEGGGN